MKIIFLSILVLFGVHYKASSQYHFVHIVIGTELKNAYPDNKPIFVTGNDLLLGDWAPKAALMRKQSDSTRISSLMLKKGHSIEFCFTDGEHSIVSVDSTSNCPYTHIVSGDTSLIFRFPSLHFSNELFTAPKTKL